MAQYYNGSESTQYNVLQATDTIHSSDKLTLTGSAGVSTATGNSGLSELATVGGDVEADHARHLQRVVLARRRGGDARTPADPQRSGVAALRLQRQGGVRQRARPAAAEQLDQLAARRLHAPAQGRQRRRCTLYRQVQNNVLLPIYVNGTVLNALGQLPYGYLQQVAAIYNSPAGCNTPPSTPFLAQQLYFTTPVSGVQRLYQGAEATGYFTLGNLVVQAYYNLTGATAQSSSFLFDNPYAITIPGQQLPNVPLQKAGIVLDYKSPHSIFEWLADAQHVGSNNPNNLPAYTTYDAGVTAQLHVRNAHARGEQHHEHVRGDLRQPGQRRARSRPRAVTSFRTSRDR